MIKSTLNLVLAIICIGSADLIKSQASYYDLNFKADSISSVYKPSSSSYAYVRSKRGSSGLNQTSSGDSARSLSITKIVLVFTEESPEDIANREEYNQERWENLIMTYPEFFQAKTTYKNICQCSAEAGGEEYKQAQGFYIYYVAPPVAVPEKKAEPAVAKTEAPATKTAPVAETPSKKETKTETPTAAPAKAAETKEAPPVAKNETPPPAPPKEEPKKEASKEVDDDAPPANETTTKKKGPLKPKKSKDPKACRPACYGYGDDDLIAFFKDNVKLSKKQKKHGKKLSADVKIQLNFDGSIKKTMVVGPDTDINKLITDALANMNPWNCAVKNGLAIKSEVRIVLKYDKESKSLKPFEIVINPKPNPKCRCMTDSEVFGD